MVQATEQNPILATIAAKREQVTGSKANTRSEAAKKAAATRKANKEAAKKIEAAKPKAKPKAAKKEQVIYAPGDGLTHATGKPRLGVSRDGGCVCGCGQMPLKKRSRFIPGHDARMYALAKAIRAHRAGESEVKPKADERQLAYLKGRDLI